MESLLLQSLTQFNQWVCWHKAAMDKVPLCIADGRNASATNPADWCDYATASAFVAANPDYGLGFVLTANDPYTVIDLDPTEDAAILANHAEIFSAFQSYAELSPSGRGCHIWCKGFVETRKFSEQKLEVYSHAHYMTVTFKPVRDVPIADCQTQLNELIASIDAAKGKSGPATAFESLPETTTDGAIIEQAKGATNGDRFTVLWEGRWNGLYPSQSEADQALTNMLWFYSHNKEQVARLYYASDLFKNTSDPKKKARKTKPDYMRRMIAKAADKDVPIADLTALVNEVKQIVEPVESIEPEIINWQKPSGLLGEIAEFIFQAAPLPSKEVALAGAIGFLAGLTGRAYNTSTGTGLNQYVVLLGGTGIGKEGAAHGIDRLCKPLLLANPPLIEFIGPREIASSQALAKHLVKSPALWSYKGELGLWLQKLNAKTATANELQLRALILDLFHKSGSASILNSSIYSDKQNNVPSVHAPAFTLIGDSTPEEFYKSIDETNIKDGMVPRLTVISCPEVRPSYNSHASEIEPSLALLDKLNTLVQRVIQFNMTSDMSRVTRVNETPEASAFQLNYQKHCQDILWADRSNPLNEIWNRAHIRLLRLGALIAIGNNPQFPIVTVDDYKWAELLIDSGVQAVVKRFESGDVGATTAGFKQRQTVGRFLLSYAKSSWSNRLENSYRITKEMHSAKVVTKSYLHKRLIQSPAFAQDKYDAGRALTQAIEHFVTIEAVNQINLSDIVKNTRGAIAYQIVNLSNLVGT